MKNRELLVEAEELSFSFDEGNRALKELNLQVYTGDAILLAGANGSGKTVLMKHFNGLFTPTAGRIKYRGREIKSRLARVRQKVGLVFQNADTQLVEQTVYDEIAFGPRNLGWKSARVRAAVESTAAHLGLTHLYDRAPHFLSGGEKKRVTIAGVLAMEPELIILDEPFAGLDYEGVKSVTEEIVGLHKRGCAVIVITHDVEKIMAHVNRLVILKDGQISYDGMPSLQGGLLEANSLRRPYGKNRKVESFTWLG